MAFPWDDITWVLLDMDGTLLDKHFDDYFWETLVPEEYARRQAMDLALARDLVFARYQREEGTLNWTDIDFWSRELELDIPALKEGIRHLIEVHPDTEDFLAILAAKRETGGPGDQRPLQDPESQDEPHGTFGVFSTQLISSFDLGHPKEAVRFWRSCMTACSFDSQPGPAGGRQRRGPGRSADLRHQVPLLQGQIQLPPGRRNPPGLPFHRKLDELMG